MNKVFVVIRVVRRSDSPLKRHYRVARAVANHLTNLSKHEVLNVGPVHTKVNHITLDIHPTASSTSLHLIRNKWSEISSHVSTEDARAERHVHAIRKSHVRKDDSQTSFLRKHLHLSTVTRESDFVGVNGDTAAEATHKSVVDINIFSTFLHVRNNILHLRIVEALAGSSEDVFVMRLCGIFRYKNIIFKTSLSFLFSILRSLSGTLNASSLLS
mmetsp:Transcript_26/g.78  ORF Transcript_26/g.78 Transcript_26/m.78 type:complete len:214 (-) Transcript_26:2381-3022(-)